jgi:hypothetical protein
MVELAALKKQIDQNNGPVWKRNQEALVGPPFKTFK